MITTRQTIVITRPPEVVFAFMLDLEQAPRWRSLVSAMETEDGTPPRQGSRIRIDFWIDGTQRSQTTTLEVCDPPRRQVYVTDERGFRLRLEYELTPVSGGTSVRVIAETTGRTFGARMTVPLLRSAHRTRFRRTLEQLKQSVESLAPAAVFL